MKLLDQPNNRCFCFNAPAVAGEDVVQYLGKQVVKPSNTYPLDGFPRPALFEEKGGRCLKNYQLVFIAEGEGRYLDSGGEYKVGPGSLFLVRPGVWHSYAPSKQRGWTEYYVGFQGNVFTRVVLYGFLPDGGGIKQLRDREKMTSLFDKLLRYADGSGEDLPLLLRSLLMLIVSESVFGNSEQKQEDDYKTTVLTRARAYMEEHISQKINLEQLSAELGVSYPWFRKIFKQQTGVSPMKFLQDLRIRKAKYLLGTSAMSIKSVGLECGFASSEYFCNCFHSETGMTPMEFRERSNEGRF